MSTLLQLRTRARQRADAVGNNFFTDAEITDLINVGLGELHDMLVNTYEDYFVSSQTFSLVADQTTYTLASMSITALYKLLGLDVAQSGDTFRMKRFSFSDRNKYKSDSFLYSGRGTSTYRYALRGQSIEIDPSPTSTDTVTVWYVPSFSALSADADPVESGVMLNWEEYAVISAAMKMREKEETSITGLEKDLERITLRIETAARDRDAGESMGITDELTGVGNRIWDHG